MRVFNPPTTGSQRCGKCGMYNTDPSMHYLCHQDGTTTRVCSDCYQDTKMSGEKLTPEEADKIKRLLGLD